MRINNLIVRLHVDQHGQSGLVSSKKCTVSSRNINNHYFLNNDQETQ